MVRWAVAISYNKKTEQEEALAGNRRWGGGWEALCDYGFLEGMHWTNVGCGPKVRGQCGGQKYSKGLVILIERIYLPRESVERDQRRPDASRKRRGKEQLCGAC